MLEMLDEIQGLYLYGGPQMGDMERIVQRIRALLAKIERW
jgi:hypothetical protein